MISLDVGKTDDLQFDTITPEEYILQSVVKVAIKDYIRCIRGGAIYHPKEVGTPSKPLYDCCVDIIKDVKRNRLLSSFYDISWEYVFKGVDDEYGSWFNHWMGDNWVHPWDYICK